MNGVKLIVLKDGEYMSEITGNDVVFTGVYCGYDFRFVYSIDTGKWKLEHHKMPHNLLNKLKWEIYSHDSRLPKQHPPKEP